MKIICLGIDLAKNVFALHGIDESGKAALVRPNVRRDQLLELIATLPPCVIGMEAKPAHKQSLRTVCGWRRGRTLLGRALQGCSGAHHWARAFAGFGHTPKLMAPKFVAPYRMGGRR